MQNAAPGLSRTGAATVKAPASAEGRLVASALEGDGAAFAALVGPHLPMLLRVAGRVTRDSALAEDAVQETLSIAYSRLGRYSPGTSLRAFLASITVRRAHTLARSERRLRRREEQAAKPQAADSPDDLVVAERTAERVREALGRLPRKRRAAALLRLDAGLSYKEVATALKTSEGSARVLVHLAQKDLREALQDILEATP